METTELLRRIYDASNQGLEIITSVCPEAAATVGNKNKFKLRTGEKTPSACLKAPSAGTVDY